MASGGFFNTAAKAVSRFTGGALGFALALGSVIAWAATGPLFHYSQTWQMIINTGTTIVTFLMVFLIQNTQNRDTEAIQIKLDELIRVTQGAQNTLLDLEDLSPEEIAEYRARYAQLASRAKDPADAEVSTTGVLKAPLEGLGHHDDGPRSSPK